MKDSEAQISLIIEPLYSYAGQTYFTSIEKASALYAVIDLERLDYFGHQVLLLLKLNTVWHLQTHRRLHRYKSNETVDERLKRRINEEVKTGQFRLYAVGTYV